jgi:hypothetical protein
MYMPLELSIFFTLITTMGVMDFKATMDKMVNNE